MSHIAWVWVTAALMLVGVAGTVIPGLPGIPLMFLIAVGFGVADGFRHLSGWEVAALLLLTLVSVGVDFLSGALGAKYGGASGRAALLGMAGFVLGMIVFPPFGGFVGMFLAVLASEMYRQGDQRRALRAATGSLIGTVAGMIAGLFIAFLFLILFLFFAWR